MNINMQDWWYPPSYVVAMAEELISVYGQETIDRDTLFQKVGEMKGVAIMLFALHKAFGTRFFMQPSKEDFPDVWTLYQEELPGKNVDTKYQTVEVVTYETHSNMEVVDFILSSKLTNPKKGYDEETIILCYIRKAGTFVSFNMLYEKLKQNKFKPTRVFVLGNTIENPGIFLLSQVWPTVQHETVHYVERAKRYPLNRRMFFKRGISKTINYSTKGPRHPINPYEVFYINEKKVKEKYKKQFRELYEKHNHRKD